MSALDTEVLIVGAGPVGLTLAGELRRRGLACMVIDRAAEPSTQSRALVLHCATQELLEEAGLRSRIADRAIPLAGMLFGRGIRRLATIPFNLGRYPALSLPQHETESILRTALDELGTAVKWGTELSALEQGPDHVRAMVGGRDIAAKFVVGCDGAHSTVRQLIGCRFDGSTLPETLWMADAIVDWDITPDHVWQFLEGGGALSAIPMPGGLWRLVSAARSAEGAPTESFFARTLERCVGHSASITEIRSMSAFRVNCRLAETYGAGRVMLAGDAAHIHSPIGGQGMNVGMQDAFSLARRLSSQQSDDPAALLAGYEADRRPVAARVIRNNARISRLAVSTGTIPRLIRDRVMPALLTLRPVSRRAGLEASGLV